jgi:hypothetical protein
MSDRSPPPPTSVLDLAMLAFDGGPPLSVKRRGRCHRASLTARSAETRSRAGYDSHRARLCPRSIRIWQIGYFAGSGWSHANQQLLRAARCVRQPELSDRLNHCRQTAQEFSSAPHAGVMCRRPQCWRWHLTRVSRHTYRCTTIQSSNEAPTAWLASSTRFSLETLILSALRSTAPGTSRTLPLSSTNGPAECLANSSALPRRPGGLFPHATRLAS